MGSGHWSHGLEISITDKCTYRILQEHEGQDRRQVMLALQPYFADREEHR